MSRSFNEIENPLLYEFNTPFNVPPFEKIITEHFIPAFKEGINQQKKEIEQIINNNEEPSFKNTMEVLDKSGELLHSVSDIFNNINSADTNNEIQKIAREVSPPLSKHADDILLNEKLFLRIKTLYENQNELNLNTEQNAVLEKFYKEFVRNGANLSTENKKELRKINEELAILTLKFSENVLAENNNFFLIIYDRNDLEGLPESIINAASESGNEKGLKDKWVFTLDRPSLFPFLQYSTKRHLREKLYKGYLNRCNNNNEFDNKDITAKMISLRVKKANLLGYKTYADLTLEDQMAKNPKNVYELLNKLWKPALSKAINDAKLFQGMISKEGNDFKLESWDWWYYAEKLKKEKFSLDDEILRPYFKLENVREGLFSAAKKLYGITFEERKDIPVYNKDVIAYELKKADGSHIAILYVDYFPRTGKGVGAWMDTFRKQWKKDGKTITPVIVNVFNFTKPASNSPSLLTFDEVGTMFHEFGHTLHSLLSNCTYRKISGTSVPRDFVEFPSQIMENWAAEPEVLKMYAKHYQTGETIPDELIEKIKNASHFNQGFAAVEYLAASFLDMDLHTLIDSAEIDVENFEKNSMNKIGLINEIASRYRTTYFNHIFYHGYSAGYYSYIWAEVLDADAFDKFKETGIFNKDTADSFRKNILAAGNSEEPMILYKRFRGREPKIDPLLEKRGLKTDL